MTTPSPEALEDAIVEVHRQIDHARAMLALADTKASLLAAGTIPLSALLLAAPSLAKPSGALSAVAWSGAAFMLAGIGFLGAVVWPRLSGDAGIRAGAHRTAEQVVARTLRTSADPRSKLDIAAEELTILAGISFSKFRRLQAAMTCFGVAGVFMLATAFAFVITS